MKRHFLENPFLIQAFHEYMELPDSVDKGSLGERLYVVLSLDIKRAIEKNQVKLPKIMLGDDLSLVSDFSCSAPFSTDQSSSALRWFLKRFF